MDRTIMAWNRDDNSQSSGYLSHAEPVLNLNDVVMDVDGYCNLSDEMLSWVATSALADIDDEQFHDASVPRPMKLSMGEKIQRAVDLFRESSTGAGRSMLAQVWVPMRSENKHILSTYEQPFFHDEMLRGYREVSKIFYFAADQGQNLFAGLPGRVFMSKVPEWTSNVRYYSEEEFLRVNHAAEHGVRGSIALPVFEDDYCCAILELVTKNEILDFDAEIELACRALELVNLSSNPPRLLNPQSLSVSQRTTLVEIKSVLDTLCHVYRLPLALTWIPCTYVESRDSAQVNVRGQNMLGPNEKSILCIRESACYWNDEHMHGFVNACAGHFLEEGQGIVGKAFQSNQPFFNSDVREFHINEYPLVHHARKIGLKAAIAIRLRNALGDNNDYILELFLPKNMHDSMEQQFLLQKLCTAMQSYCLTLRQVSEEELEEERFKVQRECGMNYDLNYNDAAATNVNDKIVGLEDSEPHLRIDYPPEKGESSSQREKKRSTHPKQLSLSAIQPFFSGSIKNAAKNLDISVTTLQKICRQYGISRWPSRKIKKVNRSLKKMFDSVEGIEQNIHYDPVTEGLVAEDSISHQFDAGKSVSFFNLNHSVNAGESSLNALNMPSSWHASEPKTS